MIKLTTATKITFVRSVKQWQRFVYHNTVTVVPVMYQILRDSIIAGIKLKSNLLIEQHQKFTFNTLILLYIFLVGTVNFTRKFLELL